MQESKVKTVSEMISMFTSLRFKPLYLLLLMSGVFLLFACENDIERIHLITNPDEFPDVRGRNMEVIYSDSGSVRAKLIAPSIKQFNRPEKPYIEFREGLHVVFFDNNLAPESVIMADYAIYYTDDRFWTAKGNVVAENFSKQEKLNTEELFWDENKKKIYSNSFSRIENPEGTFYGQQGFEANQNFTNWKLKGSRGTLNVREESANPETP